jgi:cytochrome P450
MLKPVEQYSNPYPFYQTLREQTPVFQDEHGTWFLTRYDDVKLLLGDTRFSRQPPQSAGFLDQARMSTILDHIIADWAVLNDPPRHTRLREILSSIMNPRFIKETKTLVASTAASLLNTLLQKSQVDFMAEFAYPLPVQVINQLLGSELDMLTMRRWARSLATALDHGSPDDFAAITDDALEMQTYFTELLLKREEQPKEDWISELLVFKKIGKMSLNEAVSTCIFLMLAGHETVQLTIGLGLMTLLKNPDQLTLLQSNPELAASAVEETLRFESPLNKISRWTREKIMINDIIIPENTLVVGMLNAANRDPEKYVNPERFDITRSNNRHLTFGYGIHNCIGALLARIELNVAFSQLTPHLHQFSLVENGEEWLPNSSFRYLFKLLMNIHHD